MGAAVYLVSRPLPSVMLLEALGLRSGYRLPVAEHFRWLIESLPSLLHVYAFSLLSFWLLEKRTEQTLIATISFWVAVNFLFEIGQAPSLKNFWAEFAVDAAVNKWCGPLVSYFLYGTFDWNDVAFSICGGAMAYLTIIGRRS